MAGLPLPGASYVTDGQARAQADIAVDLIGARTRYEVALEQYRRETAATPLQSYPTFPSPFVWNEYVQPN